MNESFNEFYNLHLTSKFLKDNFNSEVTKICKTYEKDFLNIQYYKLSIAKNATKRLFF